MHFKFFWGEFMNLKIEEEYIKSSDVEKFYKLRMDHYLNRIIKDNNIDKSNKWVELSDHIKKKYNLDITTRQLRYMFNEHKYFDDFVNLNSYAELYGMTLTSFVFYIENDSDDMPKFTKLWQKELIESINKLDLKDEKVDLRQRLTNNISYLVSHDDDNNLYYILEIMETFVNYNLKKRINEQDKKEKLKMALETFKALLS